MIKQPHWYAKDTLPAERIPNTLEALCQDLGTDTKCEFLIYIRALPPNYWVILDLDQKPTIMTMTILITFLIQKVPWELDGNTSVPFPGYIARRDRGSVVY